MASQAPKCLVRGSINVDEFFSLPHIVKPGETISSTGFIRRAGGKGANQAYAVAQAGGSVYLDGCVGKDGAWIREMLEGAGVQVDRLRVLDDEVTGRAIIQSAADGENSIVLHAGANFYVPPEDAHPDLSGTTHLLLQNEIPLASTLAHLTAAGEQGVTSIFNPSPMLSREQLRSFPWRSLSWLIVNEGELETLLEAFSPSETTSAPSGDDVKSRAQIQLRALHENEHFSRNVSIICTLGAQGILYFEVGQEEPNVGFMPAGKLQHPVKDTTGAGDCFAGYFTAGLMAAKQGEGIESVLRTCLTACAICVERAGAMESIPHRDQVLRR